MMSKCPHVDTLADVTQADIEKIKEESACSECDSFGPNLWLCLHEDCLKVGCGEAHRDHSTAHNKACPEHCLHLNLSTLRVWCYSCESEVFLESNTPAVGNLGRPITPTTSPTRYADTESSDSDISEDGSPRPRGLTGLQNIGNTCYMNSALQALSNTPPLTKYFLECGASIIRGDRKPGLARSYLRLVQDMWHPKRLGYVVPSSILYGIRNVHPMFRGYQQHDTQEFLRCFMDQLHEELKEPVVDYDSGVSIEDSPQIEVLETVSDEEDEEDGGGDGPSSQSEGEYETCDSGVSERSSLSDEGDKQRSPSKRVSRSPSPGQQECVRASKTKVVHSCSPPITRGSSPNSPTKPFRRKHAVKHRSIISDVFDGKLLSSVQCLTCDRVSSRVETFQDLSLPIPSRDHIHMLHQGTQKSGSGSSLAACSDVYGGEQGWMGWMWEWLRSWFWGPTVSLHDCLSAFFSADELKGDNMYSCEKCSKLRNGVKYSKVLDLPEVLCIHLKRFRHELMFSSKIGCYISFPLEGLDMRPYLHKDCSSEVTSYDLTSVICHHGTAGGGHYICYSLNCASQQWFEFDDHRVTEVSHSTVQSCESYVLFYKKCSDKMNQLRQRTAELMQRAQQEPSMMQFYVSKQWLNKFNTFAEPGPIDNSDFLCCHGAVYPSKASQVRELCAVLSQSVWEYLYDKFSGGPPCNRLYECATCKLEEEALLARLRQELKEFLHLNAPMDYVSMQNDDAPTYAIAMSWFRQWQAFVQQKESEPPGPVDNSSIMITKNGIHTVKAGSDYAQLSADMWKFFHKRYGGGPELVLRQQSSSPVSPNPPTYIANKTRSTESLPATTQQSRTSRTMSTCSDSTIRPGMASRSRTSEEHEDGMEEAAGSTTWLCRRTRRASTSSSSSNRSADEVEVTHQQQPEGPSETPSNIPA